MSTEWQYATNYSDSIKNALSNSNVERIVDVDVVDIAKSFLFFIYKYYERKSVRDDSNDRKDTTNFLHYDTSSLTDGSLDNDNNLINKIQIL